MTAHPQHTYAELCQLIEDARARMTHAESLELKLLWAARMVALLKDRDALDEANQC